jgi:sec-independent protein translocase protein TatA
MFTIVPLFPGLPGGPELLIILVVIVLLFGANKIPKLARSTGQAMGEFRRGREEIEAELKAGVSDAEIDHDEEIAEKEATSA